jgi:hypothetical protein
VFRIKKNFVFAIVSIMLLVLLLPAISTFLLYASTTEEAIPPEDIDAERIMSLIDSATSHVNQTGRAIENGNSTEALRLLAEVRTDLNNINGNVTNLIFAVSGG